MEIFLNELSLHSQYSDINQVTSAVQNLNGILLRLLDAKTDKVILLDPLLYHRPTIQDRMFAGCLDQMPDKDLRLQFKRLIRERLSGRNWRDESVQECCSYVCENEDVANTSIAELAERSIRGNLGVIVNFSPSSFTDKSPLHVVKEQSVNATLNSICTQASLEQWAKSFPELGLARYDPRCGRTPVDTETVLCDKSRFLNTKLRNQARIVYLERATGLYFCVDNLHEFGAHLEVFDAQGDHFGEADLQGVVDTGKKDETKHLNMH